MARKKRDYKAEYKRRIANASKRGQTLSQARGHAKPGEKPIRAKRAKSDPGLERALRHMRRAETQQAAASKAGVSTERLRRFLYENSLATRTGRKWIFSDNRRREMAGYSEGRARQLIFSGFDAASENGKYLAAVSSFLETNDYSFIEPFIGRSVRDAKGKLHPFETDPNTLYRLAAAGDEPFEQIYRLIE